MGYRSEIYIQVEKELENDLIELFIKHDLENAFKKQDETETTVKYSGDWLKWYEGYEDVDAINSFINENEDKAALIGIGEDGAESANEGSPDNFDMYVVSTIEW